jgi:hypothetical protein
MITRKGRVDAGFGRQIGAWSLQWPGSPRTCALSCTWRPFTEPGPCDKHTELRPSSARTRHRRVPDNTEPCAARFPPGRGSHIQFPAPDWRDTHVRGPVNSRVHGAPAAVSSTRADDRDPWPYRKPGTPASLSLRCNRPFTARARPIIQSSHRAIGKRSLDAAFNGLMMHANHLPNSEERRCLTYASSTRARSTRRAASLRERAMSASFSISSSVIANSTACRHPAMPKFLV